MRTRKRLYVAMLLVLISVAVLGVVLYRLYNPDWIGIAQDAIAQAGGAPTVLAQSYRATTKIKELLGPAVSHEFLLGSEGFASRGQSYYLVMVSGGLSQSQVTLLGQGRIHNLGTVTGGWSLLVAR